MTDVFCPRQIIFEIPGAPGVLVTATENEDTGAIDFTLDVKEGATTADLRALFFHFSEAKLGSLVISGGDGLLTESRIKANSVLDLGDGATLAGLVKKGFDIGLEWGTAGGKKDDISFPVHFTMSSTTGPLTLDDFGGLTFGAKLDSVGGPGGPRGGASKIITTAPWAPDAKDDGEADVGPVYEDGAAGLNSPSKTPQGVILDVLKNDSDKDGDPLQVIAVHEPQHGTVEILADGRMLYIPDADYSGPESFEYCVSDGHGGQDHATVSFTVQAVADEPIITYTVAQGATINEMLITVTATQNDADGSEYIDRIDVGALPAGVTITPMGLNPGTQEGSYTQQFKLTVPAGTDVDFDLSFTAVSVEKSNGDTEDAGVSIPIEIEYTPYQEDFSFRTEQQSIWGTGSGEPFDFNELIGLDLPLDFEAVIPLQEPLPLPAIDLEISGNLTFGFPTIIHLDAGNITANLYVTTTIEATYNKTTDTLFLQTSYILNGGDFTATGPNGSVDVSFKFDLNGNVEVSLEPLDTLTGWANIGFGLPDPNIDIEIVDITTQGLEETWPLPVPGVDLTLSWPDTSIVSGSLTGTGSDHIVLVNADLDAAAAYYFPPALALSDPIPGTDVDPQLLDVDVQGFVDLVQELEVKLNGLTGALVLEDGGVPILFNFGDDLPFLTNASGHDANHDGTVGFTVGIIPDAALASKAMIEFGIGASVYLFRDLPFDLDPVKLFDEELPLFDIPFFNETFDLEGFQPQIWAVV